jgi:hypothetical protein
MKKYYDWKLARGPAPAHAKKLFELNRPQVLTQSDVNVIDEKEQSCEPTTSPTDGGGHKKAVPPAPATPAPTKQKVVRTLASVKAKAKADHFTVEREHLEAIDLDEADNDDYGRFPDVDFGGDRDD